MTESYIWNKAAYAEGSGAKLDSPDPRIQPGAEVLVGRPHDRSAHPSWVSSMDEYIGRRLTIGYLQAGVVTFAGIEYNFNPRWLTVLRTAEGKLTDEGEWLATQVGPGPCWYAPFRAMEQWAIRAGLLVPAEREGEYRLDQARLDLALGKPAKPAEETKLRTIPHDTRVKVRFVNGHEYVGTVRHLAEIAPGKWDGSLDVPDGVFFIVADDDVERVEVIPEPSFAPDIRVTQTGSVVCGEPSRPVREIPDGTPVHVRALDGREATGRAKGLRVISPTCCVGQVESFSCVTSFYVENEATCEVLSEESQFAPGDAHRDEGRLTGKAPSLAEEAPVATLSPSARYGALFDQLKTLQKAAELEGDDRRGRTVYRARALVCLAGTTDLGERCMLERGVAAGFDEAVPALLVGSFSITPKVIAAAEEQLALLTAKRPEQHDDQTGEAYKRGLDRWLTGPCRSGR